MPNRVICENCGADAAYMQGVFGPDGKIVPGTCTVAYCARHAAPTADDLADTLAATRQGTTLRFWGVQRCDACARTVAKVSEQGVCFACHQSMQTAGLVSEVEETLRLAGFLPVKMGENAGYRIDDPYSHGLDPDAEGKATLIVSYSYGTGEIADGDEGIAMAAAYYRLLANELDAEPYSPDGPVTPSKPALGLIVTGGSPF